MPELSDKKLERFAQELLMNLASGMAPGKAATDAASKAGYAGSSLGPNARKRAQRKDVKARMVELAAPALAVKHQEITASIEWATARLISIAAPNLGDDAIKVPDQIAATRLLGQMHGWLAPEKHEMTGKDGGPIEVDDNNRARALKSFMARIAAQAAQKPPGSKG